MINLLDQMNFKNRVSQYCRLAKLWKANSGFPEGSRLILLQLPSGCDLTAEAACNSPGFPRRLWFNKNELHRLDLNAVPACGELVEYVCVGGAAGFLPCFLATWQTVVLTEGNVMGDIFWLKHKLKLCS